MKSISLRNSELVTVVSDRDYDWLREYRWHLHAHNASRQPYVRTEVRIEGRRTTLYMHRMIVQPPAGYKVDHRDCDGLHNWRSNLRVATHNQNNLNRRGYGLIQYKGVVKEGGFRARIQHQERRRELGTYGTAYEAAVAYDCAAYELFGEFAWLNFPELFPATPDGETIELPF